MENCKMGAQCTQQTTIQVFLKQKWVHLIVLYAKHIVHPSVLRMNTAVFLCKTDGYTKYMDTNQSQKAFSC